MSLIISMVSPGRVQFARATAVGGIVGERRLVGDIYFAGRGPRRRDPWPAPFFDTVNCYVGAPPPNQQPFIHANNWYVTPQNGNQCAIGTFDVRQRRTSYPRAVGDEPAKRPNTEDIDRAAILARRRRFILTALGGLTGVVGCERPQPPANSPPEHPRAAVESVESPQEAAPGPAPVEQTDPQTVMTDDELHALLADPELDLCVDNPFVDKRIEWSDEQKREFAEALHSRVVRAQSEGDLECALDLLENAYYRTPDVHGLAFEIGEVAAALGQCQKAREYLEHYLVYGDHEQFPEQARRTHALLESPELSSCETLDRPPSEPVRPQVCLNFALPKSPTPQPPPETEEQRRQRERSERKAERERERAAKMFGRE